MAIRGTRAILVLSLLASGCGILPRTITVDEGALESVRSTGHVVLETTYGSTWEGLTQVETLVLMDTTQLSSEAAQAEILKKLIGQGWRRMSSNQVESHRWGHVIVSTDDVNDLAPYGSLREEISQAVSAHPTGAHALALLMVSPME